MKITRFNKLCAVAFGRDIVYITIVNQFNYCLKQLRIDNKQKTYSLGQFCFNENITTQSNFNELVRRLESEGYKLV